MPRYGVWFTATASLYVEVEADNEDDALDEAYDAMPYGSSTNVHNAFDLGDWEATDGVEKLDD